MAVKIATSSISDYPSVSYSHELVDKWNDDIKDYELLVGWKGLQTIEDSYEPMMSLSKEIRVLVNNCVAEAGDQELSAKNSL
ncbi:hypothetical protein DVH05_021094 [Phytophthora capsici]|nr:hypothetical protein DVH05_021094 [Phytophthora capsici]